MHDLHDHLAGRHRLEHLDADRALLYFADEGAGDIERRQTVTFKVTVTAVAPGGGTSTGTVILKDGSKTLGTTALVAGKATFSTSLLAHGSHSMAAVYAGSVDDVASTSAVLTQKVN